MPCAPPPPVYVLLDATDLYAVPPVSLLAFEDLDPSRSAASRSAASRSARQTSRKATRCHPYKDRPPSSGRQPTPEAAASPSGPSIDHPGVSADLFSNSPLSSPESSPEPRSLVRQVAKKIKIQRPKQAGRVNLEELLKWPKELFGATKVRYSL